MQIPSLMASRPRHGGLPIPYIVAIHNGIPRYSLNDETKRIEAIKRQLCGQCGKKLYGRVHFIGGSDMVEALVSEEPAMHLECARYAMAMCPYLANGQVRAQPVTINDARAILVPWSAAPSPEPAQMAIITTMGYTSYMHGPKLLARLPRPKRVAWYAAGQEVSAA